MVKKKVINNVDKFFLIMGIIEDQITEQGNPDESFVKLLHNIALELNPEESREVMHRYMQEIMKRDYFGPDLKENDLQ